MHHPSLPSKGVPRVSGGLPQAGDSIDRALTLSEYTLKGVARKCEVQQRASLGNVKCSVELSRKGASPTGRACAIHRRPTPSRASRGGASLRSQLRASLLIGSAEDSARHLAQEIFQSRRARLVILAHHAIQDQLGLGRTPDLLPAISQFADDVEGGAEGAKLLRWQSRLLVETLESERAAIRDEL